MSVSVRTPTQANNRMREARGEVTNLKRFQRHAQSGSKSGPTQRVALMGQYVEKMYNAVQKEQSWRQMPIGPIGAHILMTDKQYGTAIDTLLGGLYKCYIVTDGADKAKLRQIISRTNSHGVQILEMKNEPRFGPFRHPLPALEREGHKTVDQVIDVENDIVYNAVCKYTHPEKALVVLDKDEAYKISFSRKGINWTGAEVSKVYNSGGDQYYPGTSRRFYRNTRDSRNQLQEKRADTTADLSQRIAERDEEASAAKAAVDQQKRNHKDRQQGLKENSTKIRLKEVEMEKRKHNITSIENEIKSLRRRMDHAADPEKVDYEYLEQELDDNKRELENMELAFAQAEEKARGLEEAARPLLDREEEQKRLASMLLAEAQTIQDQIAEVGERLEIAMDKSSRYAVEVNKAETYVLKRQDEVRVMEKNVQKEIAAGAEMGFGGRQKTRKNPHDLYGEIKAIDERIAKVSDEHGDPDVITNDYFDKQKTYDDATRDCHTLELFMEKLAKALEKRQSAFSDFRKKIGLRAWYQFPIVLPLRNYNGHLKFKLEKEEVHISVEPRPEGGHEDTQNSQGGAKKGNTSTLSGGERSLTMVSFMMALWEAMECPFRCLDEFDVFIDSSSRKIAIRTLIEGARKMSNRQFILLSQRSVESFDFLKQEGLSGEDVKLHRITPPNRGQSTRVESSS